MVENNICSVGPEQGILEHSRALTPSGSGVLKSWGGAHSKFKFDKSKG